MHVTSLQIWITLAISSFCQALIIPPRNVAEHSGNNVFHESASALKVETEPSPTDAPVPKPKRHPKPAPTPAPVPDPTKPPVPAPTEPPVPAPTEPPVTPPTDTPVTSPTEPPVLPPTDVPTTAPTKVPRRHTKPPTTLSPSNAPVLKQTDSPSLGPSNAPVLKQTDSPSLRPSNTPVLKQTDSPSLSPTTMTPQTVSPTTESPSRATPTRTPSLHTDTGDSSPTLGGDEWSEMTIPTDPPIPYVPPEDDVLKDETSNNVWLKNGESIEEMEHDRNVLIALVTVFFLMLIFSIFVAYQMVNNPDGCCANICRAVSQCACCFVGTICFPCRMLCCPSKRQRGHVVMSTNEFADDLDIT